MATAAATHDDHHDHKPGFFTRWFLSTNHKDIGLLYLVFAIFTGLVGGATKLHPTAKTALQILGVTSARELAQIIAIDFDGNVRAHA